jgi:SAM-dependent methyltransferase
MTTDGGEPPGRPPSLRVTLGDTPQPMTSADALVVETAPGPAPGAAHVVLAMDVDDDDDDVVSSFGPTAAAPVVAEVAEESVEVDLVPLDDEGVITSTSPVKVRKVVRIESTPPPAEEPPLDIEVDEVEPEEEHGAPASEAAPDPEVSDPAPEPTVGEAAPAGDAELELIEVHEEPPVTAKEVTQATSTPPRNQAPPPPPKGPTKAKAKSSVPKAPAPPPRRQWWQELFDDDYLRTVPIPQPKLIRRQVDFIEARLALPPGSTILDVGCGLGLHALELTRRGYLVVGVDFSKTMIARAQGEARDHGYNVTFLHGDMRDMTFEGGFDAALCWGTTFGYFDDDTNRQVVDRLLHALKPGGQLLLDVVNRDYVARNQPNLTWFEGDACVVMEETQLNYISSRLEVKRTVILDDGRQTDSVYSVRLYSLHELGKILHQKGFKVTEVSGLEATPGVFFGAESPKLIILAERRPPRVSRPPSTGTMKALDEETETVAEHDEELLEAEELEHLEELDASPDTDGQATPAQVSEPSAPPVGRRNTDVELEIPDLPDDLPDI